MRNKKEVCVIGGGASGMLAALAAADKGASVTILEKSEHLGQKIIRSGNGHCNLSNLHAAADAYNESGRAFVETMLDAFSVQDCIDFFARIGVLVRADQNGWLYPRSFQSHTVQTQLLRALEDAGVRCKTRAAVTSIEKKEGVFIVRCQDWTYHADAVILACGSPAGLQRGQFELPAIADNAHTAHPFFPTLVPLYAKDKATCVLWDGVRTDARVCLRDADGQIIKEEQGQLQLTKEGISGIPAFNLSCVAVPLLDQMLPVTAEIDFAPADSLAALTEALEQQALHHPTRSLRALAEAVFPAALARVLAEGVDDVATLAARCKAYPLALSGHGGLQKAQVAGGGFDLADIDPESGASKKIPGLFFCGEVLNVNGECGGYNLQFAWSSGIVAGRAAGEK